MVVIMGKWKCYICGKTKKPLKLVPCVKIPRRIVSFDVSDFYLHILTTVCLSCIKAETKTKKPPAIKKARPKSPDAKFIPTIKNILLPSTGKNYCLGCLYLPSNCLCGVKKDGKITEIHITDMACSEYIEKVF